MATSFIKSYTINHMTKTLKPIYWKEYGRRYGTPCWQKTTQANAKPDKTIIVDRYREAKKRLETHDTRSYNWQRFR